MKKTILFMLVLLSTLSLIPGVVEAKLVACIGDSNTEGHGLPDPTNECYPAQLERLLRRFDPHWETRNFGVSATTVSSQGDNPYINTTEYTEALESEPEVVILCFGTNASRLPNRGQIEESFVSDYISLIDTFAALPSEPEIWLCYPLKASSTILSGVKGTLDLNGDGIVDSADLCIVVDH